MAGGGAVMMTRRSLVHNGKPLVVAGYATLYDVPVTLEDGSTEIIRHNAFQSTLDRGAPFLRAAWNHHRGTEWASVADGTLECWQDDFGLAFQANVAATPHGASVARYVAGGAAGASILFTPLRSKKTATGTVVEFGFLRDVCITPTPAFPTAVWLDHSKLSSLPTYAQDLRRRWSIGRMKNRVARKPVSINARTMTYSRAGKPFRRT